MEERWRQKEVRVEGWMPISLIDIDFKFLNEEFGGTVGLQLTFRRASVVYQEQCFQSLSMSLVLVKFL